MRERVSPGKFNCLSKRILPKRVKTGSFVGLVFAIKKELILKSCECKRPFSRFSPGSFYRGQNESDLEPIFPDPLTQTVFFIVIHLMFSDDVIRIHVINQYM